MPTTTTTHQRWTLAVVAMATFMLLGTTVANTVVPSMRDDLRGSFADMQWAIHAYALALAVVVLTAGALADRLGRRRTFLVGLGLFSAASLAVALSPTTGFLIAARGLQGIGAGIMFALSVALIAQEFEAGRARATAMGIYGATVSVAIAVGPLLGGALTDSLGWRSVFALNVPLGIGAIAATRARVRETRDPRPARIDWPGILAISAALFMLVLALLRGNEDGWSSTHILALLAGSAIGLALFLTVELRSKDPLLPLDLFRDRSFAAAQVAAFAISASLFALFLYLALYLQGYRGDTALAAGLKHLPVTLASFLVSALAASIAARAPSRALLGPGLALVGFGVLLVGGREAGDGWTMLLPGFIVAGAGAGLVNVALPDLVVSTVPRERSATASGINDTFRQVGLSVGIAAWGALFLARGSDRARELVEAVASGHAPEGAAGQAAREGFLAGFNEIMLAGGGVAIGAAVVVGLLLRERTGAAISRAADPQPA